MYNLYKSAGGAEVVFNNLKTYSKNEITLTYPEDIHEHNFDDFDIIHVHNALADQQHFLKYTGSTKLVYDIHAFTLTCPTELYLCSVLNQYLKKPLTCANCLGLAGQWFCNKSMSAYIKLANKADHTIVHSKFMQEFYRNYDPVYLPIPLETDKIVPHFNDDGYLFYTGRMSIEKNPSGFLKIVDATDMPAKMAVYERGLGMQDIKSITDNNLNIEVVVNPSTDTLFEMYYGARYTVLPYLYSEPFGIAAANSLLAGTPLITFPFGNLKMLATTTTRTLIDMIELIKFDPHDELVQGVKNQTPHAHEEYGCKSATQKWDDFYKTVVD